MPTFTALALDRLIESGDYSESVDNFSYRLRHPPKLKPKLIPNSNQAERSCGSSKSFAVERELLRPRIKPALYTTPEATPLPDSPTSFPPSPYLINHKRRGPRLLRSLSRDSGNDFGSSKNYFDGSNGNRKENGGVNVPGNGVSGYRGNERVNGIDADEGVSIKAVEGSVDEKNGGNGREFVSGDVRFGIENVSNGFGVGSCSAKITAGSPCKGGEREDFFEPKDSSSYLSNLNGVDNSDVLSSSTHAGEFYDAWDELSSDGGTQSSIQYTEAELREVRLGLLIEIERRKQAEEALNSMHKQWDKIRKQFFLAGLTLPAELVSSCEDDEHPDALIEELCRQIALSRYVSESVGRGIAKAEVEVEMEAQMELKNFEISRLTDRLKYYEAMNHEMSQRNQEAIEMVRRNRQEQKRKQKWIWGSVAVAITIGTSALFWSYVPSDKGLISSHQPPVLQETDSSN